MTTEQRRVKQWMEKAGIKCPASPTIPGEKERMLCARLMLEETFETIQKGLGLSMSQLHGDGILRGVYLADISFHAIKEGNLVELADGLGDDNYVNFYTANLHGIDLEPCFEEICRSNDSKWAWSTEGIQEASEKGWSVRALPEYNFYCVTDETGKIRKPPTYSPANLAPIIEAQSNSPLPETPKNG